MCNKLWEKCAIAAGRPGSDGYFMLDANGETKIFREQWSQHPLPDEDLEWLMHFIEAFEEYMWIKGDQEELSKGLTGLLFFCFLAISFPLIIML